jgi:opacity protein-like surface antigen
MPKYLLAAAVAAVLATSAAARDNSPYVGIEGGVLFPQKQDIDGSVNFTNAVPADIAASRVGSVKGKTGFDVDLFGGYDFGMFRLEGELGYKQAKLKSPRLDSAFLAGLNKGAGTSFTSANFQLGDKTKVYSAMVNALVEQELVGGISGFVGGGAGYASVHQFGDSKGKFAWQLLAGFQKPVSSNIDVGIKYRYFRTGKLDFDDDFAFAPGKGPCGTVACSGGTASFSSQDRYVSHSVLASLTYNFGASEVASPPPPPPPVAAPELVAPATQTCPDGSVVTATSSCPLPPPPPPPAPAAVERGERGS